ncbi:MAG: peroxiredoxin [Desulfobacterota bacterium]|nr:peroxiredoxin [Thermodesulfobacteriota bacterium]
METGPNILCKLCCMLPLLAMIALAVPEHVVATTLKEGDSAPDLTLKNQDGKEVTLSKVWDKNIVVLYFYPMDDTPGCTKEACFFRDMNHEFRQVGAEIIGISVDDVASHKKFAEKHRLPFTLLADPEKKAVDRYGVKSKLMFGKAKRMTFVVDRGGIIRKIYPDVDVSLHSREVLDFIKTMHSHTAPRQ